MTVKYVPKGIHTANQPASPLLDMPPGKPAIAPFITIAQQIGAECFSLPRRLADIMNGRDASVTAWSHWDQELVDKVSSDHQIPTELIAALDTSGHSWLDDLLNGIGGRVDEMVVFFRIKKAVRDLASAGRVILIGHGSTYMTRDLAGGLHVRLIAPIDLRTRNVAERFKLTLRQAGRHIRRVDRQRAKFFARFWPGRPLAPEIFSAVFNVAELDEERLATAIVAMLPETPG